MITQAVLSLFLSSFSISRPSIFGIRISAMMISGFFSRAIFSPSSPFDASAITTQSSEAQSVVRTIPLRISSSSSTTSTFSILNPPDHSPCGSGDLLKESGSFAVMTAPRTFPSVSVSLARNNPY